MGGARIKSETYGIFRPRDLQCYCSYEKKKHEFRKEMQFKQSEVGGSKFIGIIHTSEDRLYTDIYTQVGGWGRENQAILQRELEYK